MGQSILLIDGSAYIFRAYFAIPHLTTKSGVPVNAVYGMTLMLLKTLREHPAGPVIVAMDKDSREFRKTIDPAYKANRPPAPEDLKSQFPLIRRVLDAMELPVVEASGYEADDVIATLSRQALAQDYDVTVVTGDKDLMQLVGERVSLFDPMKDRRYGAEEVRERYGVRPEQIRDYLALVGDTSDNVPGVPKVGPKTAVQLIERYGCVENIYAHLDEIPSSGIRGSKGIAKALGDHRAQVERAQKLVALQDELPLVLDDRLLTRRLPNPEKLRAELQTLEFYKLVADLSLELPQGTQSLPSIIDAPPPKCEVVLTEDDLASALEAIQSSGIMVLAMAWSGSNVRLDELLGIGLWAPPQSQFWYVPLGHRYLGAPRQLPMEEVVRKLSPLLESPSVEKRLHDLKSLLLWAQRYGIHLAGMLNDAEILGYLDDASRGDQSLENLSASVLGQWVSGAPSEDCADGKKAKCNAAIISVEAASKWATQALLAIDGLVKELRRQHQDSAIGALYRDLEVPTALVLARMESRGISLDGDVLRSLSHQLDQAVEDLETKAFSAAGGTKFNLSSPQQLADVLFDKLGLPVRKKGKRGPSVDQEVLESLASIHPLPSLILELRSLNKLKNTYLDVLPNLVEPDGRVHTSFHQTVTATGRLSSSDPNLQNIPVRTQLGRKVRQAFVAPKGSVLLSADYSQIELRVLAHMTEDSALVSAFLAGDDVHQRTASDIFDVPQDQVTEQMRRSAKTINFGIIYGLSAFGLSQRLGISSKEAQEMIDRYFERYSGVRTWLDTTIQRARETLQVATLWGRVRRLPELKSRQFNVRQGGERMAVNTPIQGTAADLMKRAMVDVDAKLRDHGLQSKLILQVHDELILEVPEGELEEAKDLVVAAMEHAAILKVPLKVGVGVGTSWAEAH